jgi:predicted AAA+ superfamily ATPase
MTYYKRNIDKKLMEWKASQRRKPLLIRGARQVGKSSAVRHLGKEFKYFVEINLEMAMRLEICPFLRAWAAISRLNGLRVYGRKPATVQLYSVCSYTRSATTVHL